MIEARTPPHSEEAERAVLGSILLDYVRVMEGCIEAGITADSFYVPAHRLVYDACLALHEQNKSVDLITVPSYLRTRNELDLAGGPVFVNMLCDDVAPTSSAHYIEEVKTKHTMRQLIGACRQVEAAAYTSDNALLSLSEAEKAIERIAHEEPEETVKGVWAGIKERMAKQGAGAEIGLPTGISDFDNVLDGLRKGGIYFLTGEKGAGKTTIVCNIVNNVVANSKKVMVFTLEMTTEQLMERLAGILMGTNVTHVIKGSAAVRDEAIEGVDAMVESGNLIIDAHTDGLDEFCAKVRRAVRKEKVDLVVVDYIQRLTSRKEGGMVAETADISKQVTRLAKRLKTPILCVSMESEKGLYGSRQLDYDAFASLSVRRVGGEAMPPDYCINVEVWVEKNRFGPSHIPLPLRITGRTGEVNWRATGGEG